MTGFRSRFSAECDFQVTPWLERRPAFCFIRGWWGVFSSGTTFDILQAVILVDEAAAVRSFPTARAERGGTDPRADLTGKREFVQKMRKRQESGS